ncbi:MAG TPA: hypothetical protein PKM73_02855 [Verrucomicrobiota bacterium]|nr:hypothetical protein [Verrucomicrobiota bacterium]
MSSRHGDVSNSDRDPDDLPVLKHAYTVYHYWMQHLPGPENDLDFKGRALGNWWVFLGDYDGAKERGLGLVAP